MGEANGDFRLSYDTGIEELFEVSSYCIHILGVDRSSTLLEGCLVIKIYTVFHLISVAVI